MGVASIEVYRKTQCGTTGSFLSAALLKHYRTYMQLFSMHTSPQVYIQHRSLQ